MASRLPSAVSYIATVAVTFFLAHELLGASAAPLAALVLATSAGPLLYGRSLFTDTLFGLWLAVSFLGLVLTVRGRRGLLGPLLFWSGLSLAGLTKGLVGIVLPLGTASTWWLLFGRKRLPHDLHPLLGAAIVSLVLVPWHLLLAARDPAFMRFYFVNEHVLRFFNAREPVDYTPLSIDGFWLATPLPLLPWLVASRESTAELLTSFITLLDGVYRNYLVAHPDVSFAVVERCLRLIRPFAVFILLFGGAAVLSSRLSRARLAFTIWVLGAVGLVWFAELGHRLGAPGRSQRGLAPDIRALREPAAELVVWGTYEDYCGVSLYTGYPTRMLDSARGDLLFGYRRGDASGLFLTREGFERLWASNGRVFVVGDRGLDIPGAILLAAGPRSMLVTNRPPPLPFRHGEDPSRRPPDKESGGS